MNPKLIDVMALWKHLSGVVSNLEHFPSTQQNENEIAYEHKANENLIEQQISFPKSKTTRKVTAKQLFELFYFFANRNK